MRRVLMAMLMTLGVGILLGAGPESSSTPQGEGAPGVEGNTDEGQPAEGEGAPGSEGAPGGEGAVGTEGSEDEPASTGVTVQVAEHDELGPYLTDGEGNSLYLYTTDAEGAVDAEGNTDEGQPAEGEGAPGSEGAPGGEGAVGTEGSEGENGSGSGVSTCYDACADSWPPVLSEGGSGTPVAGGGVSQELLGTAERQDGSLQITYNGWPLYYFSRDFAGYAGGQGAGGVWYLVSPAGRAVGREGEASADSEPAEGEAEAADPMVAGAREGAGRAVYEANCAMCHGEQGDGGRGPALAGNANLEDTQAVVRQIINGAPPYMPKFGDQLSNSEIASVATFIRSAWENGLGEVTEEDIEEITAHP